MSLSSPTRTMLFNAGSNYLRYAVGLLVYLQLTPLIILAVGTEAYGLWTLLGSVFGLANLLDLGFAAGTVRSIAVARGRNDPEQRNRVVVTVFAAYLALSAAASLVLVAIDEPLLALLGVATARHPDALALLWLIAARGLLLALPLSVLRGLLHGEQEIARLNLAQAVAAAAYGASASAMLQSGGDLVDLGWLAVGMLLLENALMAGVAIRRVPQLAVRLSHVRGDVMRELAGFSGHAFLVQISALVLMRTDPIVVQAVGSLAAVGIYGVALKLSEMVHILIKQAVNVMTPRIAELDGANDSAGLCTLLLRGTRYSTLLGVVLTVPVFVFASPAVRAWVGDDFAAAVPIFQVLLFATVASLPQLVASNVLTMSGDHAFCSKAAMAAVVLNLSLSVAAGLWLGPIGVALATAITAVVADPWVVGRALRRHRVPWGGFFAGAIWPSVVVGALQLTFTVALDYFARPNSLVALAALGAVSVLFGAVVFTVCCLDETERDLLPSPRLIATALSTPRGKRP